MLLTLKLFNKEFMKLSQKGWILLSNARVMSETNPMAMAHGNINRPMGRASTISACGHDTDSVFTVATLPRADCLTVWWFPD